MPDVNDRWIVVILFTFSIIALGALMWLMTCSEEQPKVVDISSPKIVSQTNGNLTIKLAIASFLSSEKTLDSYYPLANYLSSRLNRPVCLVQRKAFSEVDELIRQGTVQAAIICTGVYAEASINKLSLEVIAVPVYPEENPYCSLFVVRSDSNIQSIEELKGKIFAFTDPLSLIGYYYPMFFIIERKSDPTKYFSKTMFDYSNDASLQAVLDGIADGAAVNSKAYNFEIHRNPEIEKKLRIIHNSPPFGGSPVVTSANVDSSIRESLRKALIEMDNSQEGRKILSNLGIVRFAPFTSDKYDFAIKVMTSVREYLEVKH